MYYDDVGSGQVVLPRGEIMTGFGGDDSGCEGGGIVVDDSV